MNSNDAPIFADVQFFKGDKIVTEKRYDLYKTKLGVHNSDMWYDISCHTNNDFNLAAEVEEWAKEAAVGSAYFSDPVIVKIVQ